MTKKEQAFITAILLGIIVTVIFDLVTDSSEGVVWWHLFAEGATAFGAAVGIFLLVRSRFALKHSLQSEKLTSVQLRAEAEMWKSQSKKYIDGLSLALDEQLTRWNLTASEKEVTFLLLKGLSLKEIAEIRQTTEKTARVQSTAIYAKSGLSGRSELAAFFLEDLLLPQQKS